MFELPECMHISDASKWQRIVVYSLASNHRLLCYAEGLSNVSGGEALPQGLALQPVGVAWAENALPAQLMALLFSAAPLHPEAAMQHGQLNIHTTLT